MHILDLAAKLERDYKETMREKEKVRESLNRPLERRKRLELVAAAEQRVMVGADVFLSTLSSSLNQVRGLWSERMCSSPALIR